MAIPNNSNGQNPPPVPQITKTGLADPVWARWLNALRNRVLATLTSVNIANANGFVSTVTTDPSGQAVVTLSITASGVLKGSGGAIVAAVAGTDYIQAISATAPLSQSGGAVPNISMTESGAGSDGWLSSADWNTFNNKVSSVSATSPMSSTGGTAPTLSMTQAGTSSNGWLSSTDWNTFNGKLSGTGVTAGTYTKVTVNTNGLVTSGAQISSADVMTALGYTPAHSGANSDITSLSGLATALSVGQGGTGRATLTAHAVLLGNGTNPIAAATVGTVGNVLTDNGAGIDPSFQPIPSQLGRLLNIQVLTSTATYTKTAGTNSQIVELQAPGGGGGGTAATGVGQSAAASGGSAGAYARVYFATAVSGITVTLPAGGVGGVAGNNAGTAASAATFGAAISCPGGNGGAGGAATSAASLTAAAAQTGVPTVSSGVTLLAVGGSAGMLGLVLAPGSFSWGGCGGPPPICAAGFQNKFAAGAGITGTVYGEGGGGANQPSASGAANPGGNGVGAVCIVYEFS